MPSRGAQMDISIFIAEVISTTSPHGDPVAGLHRDRDDRCGHRRRERCLIVLGGVRPPAPVGVGLCRKHVDLAVEEHPRLAPRFTAYAVRRREPSMISIRPSPSGVARTPDGSNSFLAACSRDRAVGRRGEICAGRDLTCSGRGGEHGGRGPGPSSRGRIASISLSARIDISADEAGMLEHLDQGAMLVRMRESESRAVPQGRAGAPRHDCHPRAISLAISGS